MWAFVCAGVFFVLSFSVCVSTLFCCVLLVSLCGFCFVVRAFFFEWFFFCCVGVSFFVVGAFRLLLCGLFFSVLDSKDAAVDGEQALMSALSLQPVWNAIEADQSSVTSCTKQVCSWKVKSNRGAARSAKRVLQDSIVRRVVRANAAFCLEHHRVRFCTRECRRLAHWHDR